MTQTTLHRSRRRPRLLTPARVALITAFGLALALTGELAGPSPAGAAGPVSVHALGGAPALGTPSTALNAPIVAIAATRSGTGYWIVAASGRVFAYGDARAMNSVVPASPIVGLQLAPGATGLWLVAHNGAVYATGTAPYLGGASGGLMQAAGIAGASPGHGYWI